MKCTKRENELLILLSNKNNTNFTWPIGIDRVHRLLHFVKRPFEYVKKRYTQKIEIIEEVLMD